MARLLFVNQVSPYPTGPAGVHGVLGQAATAVSELAQMAGMEPEVVSDVATVSPEVLAATSVLVLFNIGETPWNAVQRRTLLDAVGGGRTAVLGLHSATDACRRWDGYGILLGARFDGHPWTQYIEVEVTVPDHPATVHLPSPWRWQDEVYLFADLRPDARILLRADAAQFDMAAPGARVPPHGLPLAWCHQQGARRVFYTSLGHFPAAWESPVYLRHLAGALSWLVTGA